jgi:hypothetical protein
MHEPQKNSKPGFSALYFPAQIFFLAPEEPL